MKITELKQKSERELKGTVKDLREKLRQMRFDLKAGKIKNVKEIRGAKKDIARILTILGGSKLLKESGIQDDKQQTIVKS